MTTTIDHLRDFTDAAGSTMRAGDSGVLCGLSWGQVQRGIHIK